MRCWKLSDSIKQFGIIQPLIVQKKRGSLRDHSRGNADGVRQKMAGLKRGSGYYQELYRSGNPGDFSDWKYSTGKFKLIDEARAYKSCSPSFHLKQDEVAERVPRAERQDHLMRLWSWMRVQQMVDRWNAHNWPCESIDFYWRPRSSVPDGKSISW